MTVECELEKLWNMCGDCPYYGEEGNCTATPKQIKQLNLNYERNQNLSFLAKKIL